MRRLYYKCQREITYFMPWKNPSLRWSGRLPRGRDISWDIHDKYELVKGNVRGRVREAEGIPCVNAQRLRCLKIRNIFSKVET